MDVHFMFAHYGPMLKMFEDTSRFGQDMKVYKYLFQLGGYDHDRS